MGRRRVVQGARGTGGGGGGVLASIDEFLLWDDPGPCPTRRSHSPCSSRTTSNAATQRDARDAARSAPAACSRPKTCIAARES